MRKLYLLLFAFVVPLISFAQPCTTANWSSIYCLNANDYPYTSPTSGVTVSMSAIGVPTLNNFSYNCGGNVYNCTAPAYWLNNSTQQMVLTFSAPVTGFSVIINGTNNTEIIYFNAPVGTISLSNYCTAGFSTVGGNGLLYSNTSTASTLITVTNTVPSNTYTITHNGLAAGSRCGVLDCFTTSTVLNAEGLDFFAEYAPRTHQVELDWNTLAEVDFKGFEVEHSLDGESWEVLGFQEATGSMNAGGSYEMIHKNPAYGEHFYRLKELDLDGNYVYSEVKNLRVEPGAGISIFPNPNNGRFEIVAGELEGRLEVTDMVGKQMVVQELHGHASVDLSGKPAGVYLVKITGEDDFSFTKKIVVQ